MDTLRDYFSLSRTFSMSNFILGPLRSRDRESTVVQLAKSQKKQCGGVYFWLHSTEFWMPIQQKHSPTVLLYAGRDHTHTPSWLSFSAICWMWWQAAFAISTTRSHMKLPSQSWKKIYFRSLNLLNSPCKVIFTIKKLKTCLPSLKPTVEYFAKSGRRAVILSYENSSSGPLGKHFNDCQIKLTMDCVSIL